MSEEKMVRLNFGDKECQIFPYEHAVAPEIVPYYKKLELSPAEKAQISAMCQQIPSMIAAGAAVGALNQAYYVAKWPNGLPHMLTPFKDGSGYMGTLFNESGKIAAQARFMPLQPYSLVLAGFTLLSFITGQFFLTSINQKLTVISQKLDEILQFLYGDKQAELLSAIQFTRYAYENFSSIMEHDGQRTATLQSLQTARMTAMQDVEFYLSDLHSNVHKYDSKDTRFPDKVSEMKRITSKAIQAAECLDLSIQLCMTANLLEVYYSQNYDPKYLRYVENDVGGYISRCEKQMIGDFNALKTSLDTQRKKKADWDKDKEEISSLVKKVGKKLDPLMNDEGNKMKARLGKALHSLEKETECCISADGTVYLKTEA